MYAKLNAIARRLTKAEEDNDYDAIREEFQVALRIALDDDRAVLKFSKNQLLQFVAWCSSYRPCEPHAILTSLSITNGMLLKFE
jgi:hypothetical protein